MTTIGFEGDPGYNDPVERTNTGAESMLTERDHLTHLAEIDAEVMGELYDTISYRQFEERLQDAWINAAHDAAVDTSNRELRRLYMNAVMDKVRNPADPDYLTRVHTWA